MAVLKAAGAIIAPTPSEIGTTVKQAPGR